MSFGNSVAASLLGVSVTQSFLLKKGNCLGFFKDNLYCILAQYTNAYFPCYLSQCAFRGNFPLPTILCDILVAAGKWLKVSQVRKIEPGL